MRSSERYFRQAKSLLKQGSRIGYSVLRRVESGKIIHGVHKFGRFIRSDQASFVKYGIPALAFKLGWLPGSPEQKEFNDWIHDRYHHPSDDLKQAIDRQAAVHFDRVLLTLTRRVANSPTAPEWYPESFFSTIPRT